MIKIFLEYFFLSTSNLELSTSKDKYIFMYRLATGSKCRFVKNNKMFLSIIRKKYTTYMRQF